MRQADRQTEENGQEGYRRGESERERVKVTERKVKREKRKKE